MIAISAVSSALLFSLLCEASAAVLPDSTDSSPPTNNFTDIEAAVKAQLDSADIPKARRKRYISQNDMIAILDYHNQVRGKVFPPAANMEYMMFSSPHVELAEDFGFSESYRYGLESRKGASDINVLHDSGCRCAVDTETEFILMYFYVNLFIKVISFQVWDENLAKSAEAWAATCIWDHGPSYLLRFLGQNLSMVWATSNRIGCAIHTCQNMNVWGAVWRRAVYLVCNYAPKGNWIGEAPYKVGVPCSACPPSYGGACTDNLCFPGVTSNYLYWFK
ncbi:hypothetical protein HPG69_011465 [Diceros bicornis minor]|uniref:SCP domain-containing protein n=1 Tax=Diceros bicornis minor TaxID=77932 RepID=A0A7J7FF35_DICBM|nr:hypothetical protein HPG69_011465 [Diceros bicornis minor]